MKKALSIFISIVLCFSFFQIFADNGKNVYVTICDNKGNIILGYEKVYVEDVDGDSLITINDALIVAHKTYYTESAYKYANSSYGLSINKLWNIDNSGAYGYMLNNNISFSLSTEINDNDVITAYCYQDSTYFSDRYSYFGKNEENIKKGQALEVTLFATGYDANFNMVSSPCGNAQIIVDGNNTGIFTDDNGVAKIPGLSAGRHVISAKSNTQVLTGACQILNVSKLENLNEIDQELEKILGYYKGEKSIDEYAKSLLNIENYEENFWQLYAISRLYKITDEEFTNMLLEKVNSDPKDIKWLKNVILLLSLGYDGEINMENITANTINTIPLKKNIINNTRGEFDLDSLLDLQNEDGGFGFMKDLSDPDVTAGILLALSWNNFNLNLETINRIIEKGEEYLFSNMENNGTFVSYGAANAESTSEALIYFSYKYRNDYENEKLQTIISGLKSFKLDSGAYSHDEKMEESLMATDEALLAFTALKLAYEYGVSLYDFSFIPETEIKIESKTEDPEPTATEIPIIAPEKEIDTTKIIKIAFIAIITVISIAIAIILLKKGKKYGAIIVVLVGIIFSLLVLLATKSNPSSSIDGQITVTMTFTVPEDLRAKVGFITRDYSFDVPEGSSVYDALETCQKKFNITYKKTGNRRSPYISSIFGLSEMENGVTSGWEYYVNGDKIMKSSGEVIVNDGDKIEFIYVK